MSSNDPPGHSDKERAPIDLPGWAEWLIDTLAGARHRDVVVGDFAQVFRYVASTDGRAAALRWYWFQVLRSLPSFLSHGTQCSMVMFKSYLISAIRSMRKRAFFSTINIGGLALGMAACLLILQYVAFEFSFDTFHEDHDSLYRVVLGQKKSDGDTEFDDYTWYALSPAIAQSVPEVVETARFHPNPGTAHVATIDGDRRSAMFREDRLAFADPALLRMFSYPVIQGDAASALSEPGTVLLSESTARKYFGDGNAIGRTLDIRGWTDNMFTVSGVFADVPANSHLQFDLLIPMDAILKDPHGQYAETNGWSWTNFITYARLHEGADPTATAAKIDDVLLTFIGERYAAGGLQSAMLLQPVKDIHLYTTFGSGEFSGRGYRTAYFFSLVALFILIIAWVNYINLSTARASERAKEIGIRKASGARRGQVVAQFLTEAALLNGLALCLALMLAWLALPSLNELAGVNVSSDLWRSPKLWLGVIALFGFGTLVVSLYPALVLAAFAPSTVLKGAVSTRSGRDLLRRGLVVVQFAASLTLLVGTYIVYTQVAHMRAQEVGIDVDQVVVVRRPGFIDNAEAYSGERDTFKSELAQIPGITSVASSTTVPGGGFSLGTRGRRAGQDPDEVIDIRMTWVDAGFSDTYGLTFIAGRNISTEFAGDEGQSVIISETSANELGFSSAANAVGSTIVIGRSSEREVVGVFADFHWMSVKKVDEPVLLGLDPEGGYFSIRVQTDDVAQVLASISETYQRVFPGNAFDYFFADRYFDAQYEGDQQFGTLFGMFAGLALIIACLGLVGLAAYTVAQRTKEIGIRKVLGANPVGVARLLLTDVVRLVVIALVISAPLLYLVADRWLETFATRIQLGAVTFVFPTLLLLVVAIGTVTYHTLRIARTDPVKALRYE